MNVLRSRGEPELIYVLLLDRELEPLLEALKPRKGASERARAVGKELRGKLKKVKSWAQ